MSTKATKAIEVPQNVHKDVDVSIKIIKATEATQNVHKNMDISTEVTEAPKCPQKCGHFDGVYQGH